MDNLPVTFVVLTTTQPANHHSDRPLGPSYLGVNRFAYPQENCLVLLVSVVVVYLDEGPPGVIADRQVQINLIQLLSRQPVLLFPRFDSQQHCHYSGPSETKERKQLQQSDMPNKDEILSPSSSKRRMDCFRLRVNNQVVWTGPTRRHAVVSSVTN